ncbi:hypothetical protein ACVGXP_00765, partial [Enterobacter hormaechei]
FFNYTGTTDIYSFRISSAGSVVYKRHKLQGPPFPPGLVPPVHGRIGAGDDFGPDWLDGWCETKAVCVGY